MIVIGARTRRPSSRTLSGGSMTEPAGCRGHREFEADQSGHLAADPVD